MMLGDFLKKMCKYKYAYITIACGIIHALLLITFLAIKIYPAALLNIVSVFIYLFFYFNYNKMSYRKVILIIFGEVICNAFISTVMLGWQCGFPMYMICILPATFYVSYTDIKDKKLSYFFGILSSACFMTLRFYTFYTEPVFTTISDNMIRVLYLYNAVTGFVMLLFFSLLFSEEFQGAQRELTEKNKVLQKLANTDVLTQLMNRGCMLNILTEVMDTNKENEETICVALCDIDDFKNVNDTYGHDCGDLVLQEISNCIKNSIRKNDYVCRWGGEEFLILMRNTLKEDGKFIVQRVHDEIESKKIIYYDKEIKCTMTFGLMEIINTNITIQEILIEVDKRLYAGKHAGKNCIIDD